MVRPTLIVLAKHLTSVLHGRKKRILKSVVATLELGPISVRIAQHVMLSAIVARIPP